MISFHVSQILIANIKKISQINLGDFFLSENGSKMTENMCRVKHYLHEPCGLLRHFQTFGLISKLLFLQCLAPAFRLLISDFWLRLLKKSNLNPIRCRNLSLCNIIKSVLKHSPTYRGNFISKHNSLQVVKFVLDNNCLVIN